MAGEWIKFECSLPEKPETLAITATMGWDDPDITVGKLMRVFRWFDQHTTDGNAHGVTAALLDRVIGVSGFVHAMADAGWLVESDHGLSLHNFENHNGATAKSRALTAKRVANHRSNAEGNAVSVTRSLAREEKRREEDSSLRSESAAPAKPKATKKCPESFAITEPLRAWAYEKVPGVNVDAETEKFRDHTFKNPTTDWPGAWRNWMRRAGNDIPPQVRAKAHAETPYQRSMRERANQFAPGMAARAPTDAAAQPAKLFTAAADGVLEISQ